MQLARSFEVKRYAAMTIIAVAAGLCITWLLLPPAVEVPKAPATPELRVAGMPVPLQGDPVANALDLVRRYATGEITIKLPDGTGRKIRRGSLGAEIDRVRLAGFVREAIRAESPLRKAHDANSPGTPLDVPLPLILDADAALDKLLALKGELDSAATDAYVDLAQKKLVPEKDGHRLDVYGTIARIEAAFRQGLSEVPAMVETVTPKRRAAELGNVEFSHVLGYFETRYNQGEKMRDRTYNLRQAASRLDGAVVLPGEIFDFNDVVGPRDEAHGYRVAPVIAQGELVDGLGGGTCQISGTLHGAAFFSGLDIVERYPHSRPSYYIKLGLDATVVYPTINFRFRNPFKFPIVLHETVSNGVVRAEILGPERHHTVTYFRRIDEVVPFEEVERKTPKLPEGTRVLAQRGIPGFKTTSSRVVRDGAHAVRYKWTDSYPPTMQIFNVGSGPKELTSTGKDDEHPEYIVDEYLVVTQGPEIHTPGVSGVEAGGGTIESREPGKTGERGYYEKLGLSHYRSNSDSADPNAQSEAPATVPAAAESPTDDKNKKPDEAKPKKKKKKKKGKTADSGG
ncbi:MAG TPA: VanW family protein [Polyangium sp.]|jgi:vancomycin resistance protein YoaR|nr:VanW family protein [Polyangium sp.]